MLKRILGSLILLGVAVTSLPAQVRFSAPINTSTGGVYPSCAATGDFNRDGKLDVAVINRDSNSLAILLANGPGTFKPPILYSVDVGSWPISILAVDLNKDGKLDLVIANALTGNLGGTIIVLLGNGDGTFSKLPAANTANSPMWVTSGDLNRDGKPDLFIGGNGSSSVMLGRGDGTFVAPTVQNNGPIGTAPAVALGDFNGDGLLDAATANRIDNSVGILLGNGDGTFKPYTAFAVLNAPIGIVLGDFNRDGKLDVAVAEYDSDALTILPGNGDGTLGVATHYYAGSGPNWLSAADFNADKKTDFVFPNLNGTGVTFEFGKGDGSFANDSEFASGNTPSFTVVGDFNRDGAMDVAVTNAKSNNLAVLLNMAGTFVTSTSSHSPSLILQPVTITTKVRPSVSGAYYPTGSVTFKDGTVSLGTATLVSGQASITVSTLNVGSHTIHPIYSGDANFNPKTGSSITQVVTRVALSPSTLSFGPETVGTSSSAKILTLTNRGSTPLSISSIALAGTNPADFAQTNTCGTSVAAGASCTVNVTFRPKAAGTRSATLNFYDDGGGSPQKVSVSGSGN